MENKNTISLKCKEKGCPCYVYFTGKIELPGNFIFLNEDHISKNSIIIDLNKFPYKKKLIDHGAVLTIFKKENVKKFNSKTEEFKVELKYKTPKQHIFYLTCNRGHTHPYKINII